MGYSCCSKLIKRTSLAKTMPTAADVTKEIRKLTMPRLEDVETPTPRPRPEEDSNTPRPEEGLNIAILLATIFWKMTNGFGTLSFVWATVVLLGGFATLITQRDFWFVTIISFVQAVGIFGGSDDSTTQFAPRLSQGLLGTPRLPAEVVLERDIWRRNRDPTRPRIESSDPQNSVKSSINSACCCICLGGLLTVAIFLAKLAAVTLLLILSSMRLSKQDYVDPMFQGDQEHKNIRRSLNIFYVLVLAQGICFLCRLIIMLNPAYVHKVLKVQRRYRLGISGKAAFNRYVEHIFKRCTRGDVRAALNMDFVSFAMELAVSSSAAHQLLGVRTIDDILSARRYRKHALASLRASPETLEKLLKMLQALGPANSPAEEIRGPAASIVLDLAPRLTVELVPGMIQLVSGLLDDDKTCGDTELTWFGLSIIEKLMDNPNNRLDAVEAAGRLVPKLIILINRYGHHHGNSSGSMMSRSPAAASEAAEHATGSSTTASADNRYHTSSTAGQDDAKKKKDEEEILEMSLRVLHKLVATDAEAVKVLKCDTEENIQFLSNARLMMGHVEAIRIIACCALDEEAKEEIGKYPEIIKALKTCLLISGQEEHSAAAAAEALVLLTMDSHSNVVAFLEETDSREMQQVVDKLFLADGGHTTTSMAAKLLRNLRAYSGTEYPNHLPNMMHIIDRTMPEVLEAVVKRVTNLGSSSVNTSQNSSHVGNNDDKLNIEQGEVLESFIGLAVQICASLNSCDLFAEKHEIGSHPTIDILVQKLKQILQMYHSPTTEIPEIRRVTIELMIWIMQGNKSNIATFRHFNVAAELEQVVRSARKLESFRLFYSGVGVARYNKPVSRVARAALALITQAPAS